MSVKLVAQSSGQVIEIRTATTLVGRQSDCSVRIPSGQVSRHHCELAFHDGQLTVEDLDSSNGTFLNGKRVKKKRLIHPGDLLQIGPITFTVDYALSDTAVGGARAVEDGEGAEELEVELLEPDEVDEMQEPDVEEVEELEPVEEGDEAPTVHLPPPSKEAAEDGEEEEEDRPKPARSDPGQPLKVDEDLDLRESPGDHSGEQPTHPP